MNRLVMLLTDDDGREYATPVWHLIDVNGGGYTTFCSGEYFGEGESNCKYRLKEVKRGGITCPRCLEKIKAIKEVKL